MLPTKLLFALAAALPALSANITDINTSTNTNTNNADDVSMSAAGAGKRFAAYVVNWFVPHHYHFHYHLH